MPLTMIPFFIYFFMFLGWGVTFPLVALDKMVYYTICYLLLVAVYGQQLHDRSFPNC